LDEGKRADACVPFRGEVKSKKTLTQPSPAGGRGLKESNVFLPLQPQISIFDELTLMFDKRQGKGCTLPFPQL